MSVAIVPLWQLIQLVVIAEWSNEAGVHLRVEWHVSQSLLDTT